MKSARNKWERDIVTRQRNVVFPDTVANEARFWRNLIQGRRRLSPGQVVGIALIAVAVVIALYEQIAMQVQASDVHGTLWQRIVGTFGSWIVVLALGIGALLVGQFVSNRRARKAARRPPG